MKLLGKMQQTIRIEADLFLRIAKYAEALSGTNQNELYNSILKAGIETLEKIAIDNGLTPTEVPTIYTDTGDSTGTPPREIYTDTITAVEQEHPNKDITAPDYDEVTEGYNPHEKPRNTLKV
jgi:hypothetical protein